MNRRAFLHTSTAAAVTSLLTGNQRTLAALASDDLYRQNIGLQVYTLRHLLKDDTEGTLKAVAAMGYKQVETYSYPTNAHFVKTANNYGLRVYSSHIDWDCVVNPEENKKDSFDTVLWKAKANHISHLVIPYLAEKNRTTLDDYKRVAENCNKAAIKAKAQGIQLSYHNHAFEFEPKENGKSGFEIFIEEFAPEMQFEIDVFWVHAGQNDPVKVIENLSGRVSQLHLKDLRKGVELPKYNKIAKEDFIELGKGSIDMAPIIRAAHKAGVKHCHVEQDHSPDPMDSIKQSLQHIYTI